MQAQEALQQLQDCLNSAADMVDRMVLLTTWADPLESAMWVGLMLFFIVCFATFGLVQTVVGVLLFKMRPPCLRSGTPDPVQMMMQNLPRVSQL